MKLMKTYQCQCQSKPASGKEEQKAEPLKQAQFLPFINSCQCPSYIFPKSSLHTLNLPHNIQVLMLSPCNCSTVVLHSFHWYAVCFCVYTYMLLFKHASSPEIVFVTWRGLKLPSVVSRAFSFLSFCDILNESYSSHQHKLLMKVRNPHLRCPLHRVVLPTWSFVFLLGPPEATEFADSIYRSWFLAAFPLPFFLRFLLSIKAT